jgi:putative transposase
MKKTRYTENQIIQILKEAEAGKQTADICREYGISSATFYNRKAKYGGMKVQKSSGCVTWKTRIAACRKCSLS